MAFNPLSLHPYPLPLRLFSIAPMMDYTDRHCRYFLRLISQHCWLYTEMIHMGAILHGDKERFLAYHANEHPLALQLGGSDPSNLAASAKIAEDYGYDEINLNVGCPSDRVQLGKFGACLMKDPTLVSQCVAAMRAAVKIPVTVKTRIGVDDEDSYEYLKNFITQIAAAGCDIFIMHARKAWLKGLSPKENREIPPLCYEKVYQLKQDFPHLTFIINGGIKNLSEVQHHLKYVDGVMLGREVYRNPYLLAEVDNQFYGDNNKIISREEIVEKYKLYVQHQLTLGVPLSILLRPVMGLFQGMAGAKTWRRSLTESIHQKTLAFSL